MKIEDDRAGRRAPRRRDDPVSRGVGAGSGIEVEQRARPGCSASARARWSTSRCSPTASGARALAGERDSAATSRPDRRRARAAAPRRASVDAGSGSWCGRVSDDDHAVRREAAQLVLERLRRVAVPERAADRQARRRPGRRPSERARPALPRGHRRSPRASGRSGRPPDRDHQPHVVGARSATSATRSAASAVDLGRRHHQHAALGVAARARPRSGRPASPARRPRSGRPPRAAPTARPSPAPSVGERPDEQRADHDRSASAAITSGIAAGAQVQRARGSRSVSLEPMARVIPPERVRTTGCGGRPA